MLIQLSYFEDHHSGSHILMLQENIVCIGINGHPPADCLGYIAHVIKVGGC
jgi:hypothetical protein